MFKFLDVEFKAFLGLAPNDLISHIKYLFPYSMFNGFGEFIYLKINGCFLKSPPPQINEMICACMSEHAHARVSMHK